MHPTVKGKVHLACKSFRRESPRRNKQPPRPSRTPSNAETESQDKSQSDESIEEKTTETTSEKIDSRETELQSQPVSNVETDDDVSDELENDSDASRRLRMLPAADYRMTKDDVSVSKGQGVVYMCRQCVPKRRFRYLEVLEQHKKLLHCDKNFMCPVCGLRFLLPYELRLHRNVYADCKEVPPGWDLLSKSPA